MAMYLPCRRMTMTRPLPRRAPLRVTPGITASPTRHMLMGHMHRRTTLVASIRMRLDASASIPLRARLSTVAFVAAVITGKGLMNPHGFRQRRRTPLKHHPS